MKRFTSETLRKVNEMKFLDFLQLHADAGTLVNATTTYVNAYTGEKTPFAGDNDLSVGMKTFYDTALLENARAELVHAQFGRKQPLPANRGRTIEWRKWNTLPKALKPLTEGVIPTGQKFGETAMTTSLSQHGMYVTVTDLLDLHDIDPVIAGATEELGASAGGTEDTLVRNVILQGTNVLYADTLDANGKYVSTPAYRYRLQAKNNRLTPDMVHKAKTKLVKLKAPKINGYYVAIIHPSVAYDLTKSEDWIEFHQYAATTEIFAGEIGELRGVRFVETTEAGIYCGEDLSAAHRYLSITAYSGSASSNASAGVASAYRLTVSEDIDESLVGRLVLLQDVSADGSPVVEQMEICGINATSKYIYVKSAPTTAPANGDFLVPGEGGQESHTGSAYGDTDNDTQCAIYCTLFLGKEAYGVIDPAGGGLEMIVKDKSRIGGPLNQFSTVGYKFEFGAKILYEDRMVRVESCSEYSETDKANDTIIL